MANTTIGFGAALIAVGLFGYFGSGMVSMTAMIPAAFGLLLALAGFLARDEARRKHAMHAAAVVGLLGVSAAIRPAKALSGGASINFGIAMQLLTAGLSALFVGLCIRSFIAARRARG